MIREVQESDAEAIFDIISAHAKAGSVGSPKWTLEQVKDECRKRGFVSHSSDGRIRAFVLFQETPDAWEISYLATSPNALRSGAMAELLAYLVSNKPAGCAVWLEVHESNEPARRLYSRAGFSLVGRRERYYSDGAAAVLYSHG